MVPPTKQTSVKFGDSALVFNESRPNKLGTLLRFEGFFSAMLMDLRLVVLVKG